MFSLRKQMHSKLASSQARTKCEQTVTQPEVLFSTMQKAPHEVTMTTMKLATMKAELENLQSDFHAKYAKKVKEFMGPQLFESVIQAFQVTPETLPSIPIETLITASSHPQVLLLRHRSNFQKREKSNSETLQEYFQSLIHLADKCEFGSAERETRLKEQLLVGLPDQKRDQAAIFFGVQNSVAEIVAYLEGKRSPSRSPVHKLLPTADEVIKSDVPVKRRTEQYENLIPAKESKIPTVALHREKVTLQEPTAKALKPLPRDLRVLYNPIKSKLGIEGRLNSCYMDTSLMSLFMYDTSFESCLSDKTVKRVDPVLDHVRDQVRAIREKLQRQQYLDLRSGLIVEFRAYLTRVNPQYKDRQMDPEEFIITLFEKGIGSKPFYTAEGNGGYVFQLLTTTRQSDTLPDVQRLLEHSFEIQGIQLDDVPRPGFILKLPVTNGVPVLSSVLPNTEISLKKVLANGQDVKMALSAVICLNKNHFTLFVRKWNSRDPDWIYLDSFQYGGGAAFVDFNKILEALEHPTYRKSSPGAQSTYVQFLLRTAYMCVYLPLESTLANRRSTSKTSLFKWK